MAGKCRTSRSSNDGNIMALIAMLIAYALIGLGAGPLARWVDLETPDLPRIADDRRRNIRIEGPKIERADL